MSGQGGRELTSAVSVGNLVNYKKVNETSTEARLAPHSCTADYTNSWTYVNIVYCVVQLGPRPFCQTNTMQTHVASYRDRVAHFFLIGQGQGVPTSYLVTPNSSWVELGLAVIAISCKQYILFIHCLLCILCMVLYALNPQHWFYVLYLMHYIPYIVLCFSFYASPFMYLIPIILYI